MTTVPAEQKILFLITAAILAAIGLRSFKNSFGYTPYLHIYTGLLSEPQKEEKS